jgi:DNA (cytosine-5)-methyltransferase 1
VDIVVGGPPCQGFSVAGRRLEDYLQDERNHQVFNFLDIVEGISPKAFVMENVRGITTTGQKDGYSILNQLINRIQHMGYKAKWQVLNAENYYVPQRRRRMFLVGVRNELGNFEFPYAQCGENSDLFSIKRKFTTVREALDDLPYPNDGSFLIYDKTPKGWFQRLMRTNATGVDGHSTTKHSPEFIVKLAEQKLGSKLYPNWNHSWVKFDPDEIAPTIKENHRAPGVHYERPMCISPRECARLQAMPDSFTLAGNKTQRLIQVGNAVPPLLAAAVATELGNALGVRVDSPYGIPVNLLVE